MSQAKKWAKYTLRILGAVVILFFALNIFDSELDPDVENFLNRQYSPSAAEIQGFQYLLALTVSPETDVAAQGREYYEKIKKDSENKEFVTGSLFGPENNKLEIPDFSATGGYSAYLPRETYLENKTLADSDLKKFAPSIARFDGLLKHKSFGSDLKPNMRSGSYISALLKLSRIKRYQLNLWLHEKKEREALIELVEINRFFIKSLDYPMPLLSAIISLSILKSNQEFVREAFKEYPYLKVMSRLPSDLLVMKNLPSFAELSDRFIFYEVNIVTMMLSKDLPAKAFEYGDSFGARLLSALVGFPPIRYFVLKKNKTINDLYANWRTLTEAPCVQNLLRCPPVPPPPVYDYFINPIGKFLIYFMTNISLNQMERLHQTLQTVSEPI